MRRLRAWMFRLGGLFRTERQEQELADEMESHLQFHIEDNLRFGMTPEQARRDAILKLGGVEQTKQAYRERSTIPLIENTFRNVRYTSRTLRKNPSLTVTVLLTLALGIGANTAIFTVDYATLLAPLPYPHPEQLVVISSKERQRLSAGDFLDWKRASIVFQDMNAWTPETSNSFNLATRDQPESIPSMSVTPGYYGMLGEHFYLGRGFLHEEGQPGKDHVVILTHKLWKRLGSDSNIVGKTMHMNGAPYTVVGVLARGLADRRTAQVIVPLVFKSGQFNHFDHWLLATGRLKPGVTLPQAQAELNAITAHDGEINPESKLSWGALVEPLQNDFLSSDRKLTLWLLMGAVGFVLLIACVNVANLLLAKSLSRRKELAVRSSLGATSRTIFLQLLTESLMLAISGGILGVGVGYLLLRGLIAVLPPNILPPEANLHLSLPILIFTLAATTIAGLFFGCVPAWHAMRVDPAEALKEGGHSGTGVESRRLRQALVVGEFVIALSLLAGAGLTIHSFWNLTRVDLGIRADHVLTFHLQVPDSRPKKPEQIVAYYRQILTRIESVPGVSGASATVGNPLEWPGAGMLFSFAGKPESTQQTGSPFDRPGSAFDMVTPSYFQTLGVRTVEGHAFTDQDNASSVKVAMVSEDFVRRFLKGTDPLQQRLIVDEAIPGGNKLVPVEWQIVGVFHDVRIGEYHSGEPEVYLPFWQSPRPSASISVRTAEDPTSMVKSIAAAVHAVDPLIALAAPRTLNQVREDVLANDRFTMLLFACFAIVALLLASVGIYGVLAYSVAQRSHEIAIRIALGATRSRVVRLVVKEGVMLAFVGLGFGLTGACFVGREMQSILFGVSAIDFRAFGAVGAILMLAAMLASYLPARRAASTDPMRALRAE